MVLIPFYNQSYLYSLVFAADMYATGFKHDPLDPARGRRYREKVLRPGASRDEIETLTVSSLHLTMTWI